MGTFPRPDAVITGVGVVAPTGIGAEEHWHAVRTGTSGIARIGRFDPSSYPVQNAGEVRDFEAERRIPGRLIPQTDRWTQMSLLAAADALDDAGITPTDFCEYDMAVVTSSSSGGVEFGQREMTGLYQRGPEWVGAYQSIAWFYAATTGQVSIRHGMRGPCGVVCAEQAGGLDALAQARRLVRGGTQLVVSGGLDSLLAPFGLVAEIATGRLSTVRDPSRAYLPFDLHACGYLPGEGGAILLVEPESPDNRERTRGHLLGYASGFDPAAGSGRHRVLRAVIERALADAEIRPGDVDVVFADAMALPADDAAEAAALAAVFGPHGVPVTAPKALTGRLYGGGAPLDVVSALLSLRDGIIPPTPGTREVPEHYGIDLVVTDPRAADLRVALVLACGRGGFTSAVVLGRPRDVGPPPADEPSPRSSAA